MDKERIFYELLGLPVPEKEPVLPGDVVPYMPEISLWGEEKGYDDLLAAFGGIYWACSAEDHPDATHRFRVVGLHLQDQPNPNQYVEVYDKDGHPVPGIPIVRSWPYPDYYIDENHRLPDWTADFPQTTQWTKYGVVIQTDGYGRAEFNMGRGDAFFPERTGGGFSCVYPAHHTGEGHVVHRLGWLDGLQYPAVQVIYLMEEVGEEPGPGPTPEGDVRIFVSGIELTGTIEQLDG